VTADRRLASHLLDIALLAALKLAIGVSVLHAGFSHVSDDDYARSVIAEQFAHSPRFDPSETSWLPLPFWITGAAMSVGGRSLDVARIVAMALAAGSVAAPYAAMRILAVPRATAVAATVIGMALPWNAWLGVATVPEGWTGALVAAAVIAMIDDRAMPWSAAALLAASLSRYEAWPACAVFALRCGVGALREHERALGPSRGPWPTSTPARWPPDARAAACALVALAGPALWMAWNAHAHGSAFHFITRVSTFRRAIGAADASLADKLLDYPRALFGETPEAGVLTAFGVAGLVASRALRTRWAWPAASALAVGIFLVVGDLGDGAPTHHPARALGPVLWILVGMGVDAASVGIDAWGPGRIRVGATAVTGVVLLAWLVLLPFRWAAAPGEGDSERRDAQIARGLDLRERAVTAAEIVPCEFEHFALIAAWGKPERAHVHERTHETPTPDCPRVTTP
jgi:hypothetical protein